MKYVHWNHSRGESLVKGGVHQAADGEVNTFSPFSRDLGISQHPQLVFSYSYSTWDGMG